MEKWIEIKEYSNYQISSLGRVRNKKGRIMKLFFLNSGYLFLDLCKNHTKERFSIHRLVAGAFLPNTENKPCVNHKNSIKTDNRLLNLEWVTYSENTQHAKSNNKLIAPKGSINGQAKLTNDSVLVMREAMELFGVTPVAKYFNLAISTCSQIHTRTRWKHI